MPVALGRRRRARPVGEGLAGWRRVLDEAQMKVTAESRYEALSMPNARPSATLNADASYRWHPEYRNSGFLLYLARRAENQFLSWMTFPVLKGRWSAALNPVIATYLQPVSCAPMGLRQLGVSAQLTHGRRSRRWIL